MSFVCSCAPVCPGFQSRLPPVSTPGSFYRDETRHPSSGRPPAKCWPPAPSLLIRLVCARKWTFSHVSRRPKGGMGWHPLTRRAWRAGRRQIRLTPWPNLLAAAAVRRKYGGGSRLSPLRVTPTREHRIFDETGGHRPEVLSRKAAKLETKGLAKGTPRPGVKGTPRPGIGAPVRGPGSMRG